MNTATQKKSEQQQAVNHPFNDLCINCMHREACSICKARTSAIHFCEEYEAATLQGIQWDNSQPVASPMPPVESGICVNCAHRSTCKVERPEGGIWHCEEYA